MPSLLSISPANSDVAKVLELKDPRRSEGHTRNRENYFVKLFSMLKSRKFWSSKIKSYTVSTQERETILTTYSLKETN